MKKNFIFITILLLLLISNNTLFSGTTGKLMGRVTDANSGNPIIGANIIILEKQMGTTTDPKGRYIIINIPPGSYNVQAKLMGYQSVTKTDVKINLDLTTTLNFQLNMTAKQIEGIVVKAKRDLIEKDVTGSEEIITKDDMEHMPVDNIQGIVAVTAGAVGSGENLHIRGGRSGEVVYTVDGMSISNPVDNAFGMSLDLDAVSDMSIQTGGFTAEFGNAQSAIINLVTKSGGPNYSGKFEFNSDHIFNEGNNSDLIKFSLGGPLFPFGSREQRDKFTFFINGSGSWTDGRYMDYYSVKNDDVLWIPLQNLGSEYYQDSLYIINNINKVGGDRKQIMDFFDKGNRFRNNYQANAKLKFQLNPKVKITFAARGDREVYLPFTYARKYSLEHYDHWTTTHNQQAFTWDQTVSPTMFYTIRGSRFGTDISLNSGVDKGWYFLPENTDWDSEYWSQDPVSNNYGVHIPGLNENEIINYMDQFGDYRNIPYFSNPGTHSGSFIDDETTVYSLRSDLTYQISQIIGAKTGIELKYNEIYKDRLFSPWNIDDYKRLPNYLNGKEIDTTLVVFDPEIHLAYGKNIYLIEDFKKALKFAGGNIDGYKAFPWQGAYYLQTKLQWEGLIANLGMRFDFWYLGDKYQVKDDSTGNYIDAEWDFVEYIKWVGPASDDYGIVKEKVKKFQLMVSPRVGVSHPITDKDVLHFAYNYQSQLPPMQYVFTSATPEVGAVGAHVGNPNLKPETTITYEVGVEHQMGDDYLLDITLFYKNIHNLVSQQSNDFSILPDSIAESGKQYFLYITNDYGSARGAEFTLRKRFSNFWGFNVGYTYSFATGRNSGAHDARDNLREFPLNWDIRHIASINFDFRIPQDEEFYILGIRMPDKFYANILWQIQSGEPYTPLSSGESDRPLDTNSERMDWTNTASLRISKAFNIIGNSTIKLSLNISNLFNTKNINWVYAKTGKTDDDGDYWQLYDLNHNGKICTDEGEDEHGAAIYMAGLENPNRFSECRKYSLGVSFEW